MLSRSLRTVAVKPSAAIKPTQSVRYLTKRQQARLDSIEKKKENLALQSFKEAQREKVDPVLGRPNNPFIRRISMEVSEPNILARGYQYHEVEKLLHGAKKARELRLVSFYGQDEEQLAKMEAEEAEKKEVVLRILSMRNAPNSEHEKQMVEFARSEFQRCDGDTGSPEVQAAIATVQIHNYMRHVKENPQDLVHIRRVRMLTQKRQRILRYLKRDDPKRYFFCIEKLGLTDENVHQEFNFDRKYADEFEVWPGRRQVRITKQENEDRRRDRRSAKVALRRAMSQGGLKEIAEERQEQHEEWQEEEQIRHERRVEKKKLREEEEK